MDRSTEDLLSSQALEEKTRWQRWRRYLGQDVDESWADAILLVLGFVAGIVDSAVFNVWSCFVSMQTGNTVYVGLGISHQPLSQPYRWAKSGTAILSFCVGNYVFSRVCRWAGQSRRSTMCGSCIVQAALCLAAGTVVVTGVVPKGAGDLLPGNCIVLLPLAMLSFQSAGQITMSRVLAYNELPTVVLTSTYCDLFMDPMLLAAPIRENSKRNRRALSVVALLAGAAVGGLLTQEGDIANALWITAVVKIVLAGVWLFWNGKGSIQLD